MASDACFEASSLEEASLEQGHLVGRSSMGRVSKQRFRRRPVKGEMGRVSILHFRGWDGPTGHGRTSKNKTSNKKPPKRCLDKHGRFAYGFGLVKRTDAIGFRIQPNFGAVEGAAPNAPTQSRLASRQPSSRQPPSRQLPTELGPN